MHAAEIETAVWVMTGSDRGSNSESLKPNLRILAVAVGSLTETSLLALRERTVEALGIQLQEGGLLGKPQTLHLVFPHLVLGPIEKSA